MERGQTTIQRTTTPSFDQFANLPPEMIMEICDKMSIDDLNEHIATSKTMYALCKTVLDKKKQDYIDRWLMEEADTFTDIDIDDKHFKIYYRENENGYPIEIIVFKFRFRLEDNGIDIIETKYDEGKHLNIGYYKNESELKKFIIPNNLKPDLLGGYGISGSDGHSFHNFWGESVAFTIDNDDFAAKLYIVEQLYSRGFIEFEDGTIMDLVHR